MCAYLYCGVVADGGGVVREVGLMAFWSKQKTLLKMASFY